MTEPTFPSRPEKLLDEVRLLFNRAAQLGEELHTGEPVTMAMRAVLEYLHINGPTTVPAIARSRNVTRQHIQTLVDDLLKKGLVELGDNPAHKRSSLVALTPDGSNMFQRMQERERSVFSAIEARISEDALRQSEETLRAVREAMETVQDCRD